MADQESNQDPKGAPPADAPKTTDSPTSVDPAEFRRLQKENAKLKRESQSTRQKRRQAEKTRQRSLEKQGQYRTLARERGRKLKELKALRADAKLGRVWREEQEQRIQGMQEKLPEHWRSALEAAQGLPAKSAILSAYEAEQKKGPPPRTPPSGGPPGTSSAIDFSKVTSDEELAAAIERDPEGWEAYKAKLRDEPARPLTTWERIKQRAKK